MKTDREIVLQKWPDAQCVNYAYMSGKVHIVTNEHGPERYKSRPCFLAATAWCDAATRIRKEGNQPSQEPSAASAASASLAE